jgi:septal ring factor EnvC (AmiA/AmiB activator)
LNSDEIFTRELTFQFNGLGNEPTLHLCYVQIGVSYRLSPCNPNSQNTQSEQTNGALAKQQTQIETQALENQKLQKQLKRQQAQIDALKLLVCQQNPTAAACAALTEK